MTLSLKGREAGHSVALYHSYSTGVAVARKLLELRFNAVLGNKVGPTLQWEKTVLKLVKLVAIQVF